MTAGRLAVMVGVISLLGGACGGKQTSDSGTGGGGAGASGGTGALGGAGALGGTGTGANAGTGTGASAGTGGTGASSTGGTGGSTACVSGGACASPGETCTPPGCCECSYMCTAGKWQVYACPGCLPPSCPDAAPSDGDPCNECLNPVGQPCSYGQCPSGVVQAICDAAKWHVEVAPCPPKQPCGSAGAPPCPPGNLCVYPGGLGDMPYCAPNPCSPYEPVSCACAASLCTYGYCSNATPSGVYCDCPNC